MFPGMLLCFCAGIGLADAARIPPEIPAGLGVFAVLVGLFLIGGNLARLCCSGLATLAAGCLALDSATDSLREPDWVALEATVEGEVCRFDRGSDWFAVELCHVQFLKGRQPDGLKRLRIMGRLDDALPRTVQAFSVGEVLRARVRLERLSQVRNPGARSRVRAFQRRGVGAVGRLVDPLWVVRVDVDGGARPLTRLRAWVDTRRYGIATRLDALGPGGGLLAALGIGDRSRVPASVEAAFVRLGVAHLLAVSGLHLYLIAGFAYLTAWQVLSLVSGSCAAGDPRRASLGVAALAALGYALLAGWGVPVQRALLMFLALGAGFVAQRVSTGINLLALAGLLILAHDPSALFMPGAQLSFAATAGLMLCANSAMDGGSVASQDTRLQRSVQWLRESIRVSAVAIVVTAPLIAIHGWVQSGFGLLGNLVFVPLASLVLLPGSVFASLLAGIPEFSAGEAWLAWTASVMSGVGSVAVWIAAWLPEISNPREPAVGTGLLAIAIAALALLQRSLAGLLVCCALVLGVLAMGPRESPEVSPWPRMVVLEVGHGDAIVVQGQTGTVLVDAGRGAGGRRSPQSSMVVSALVALGISELDVVVATHADEDHRGGLEAVLRAMPVGEIWLPYGGHHDPGFQSLRDMAERRRVQVVEHGAGDMPEQRGDLVLRPLWPPRESTPGVRNEGSLVVRVEREGFSALLTGDVGVDSEEQLLASGAVLESTVLKVGHHGSRGSSSAPFLRAVSSELAVVSAGCSLRRGLPSSETLARISASGAATWWTARDGAVVIPFEKPARAWGWAPESIARGCGKASRY